MPSLVHWKLGHYAAVVEQVKKDGKVVGYQIEYPTFGQGWVMSADAMEKEASGYFLVPGGALPKGWNSLSEQQVAGVYGKGLYWDGFDAGAWSDYDKKVAGCGQPGSDGQAGMAHYSFDELLVSLRLEDVPLSYRPVVGPKVPYRLVYSQ